MPTPISRDDHYQIRQSIYEAITSAGLACAEKYSGAMSREEFSILLAAIALESIEAFVRTTSRVLSDAEFYDMLMREMANCLTKTADAHASGECSCMKGGGQHKTISPLDSMIH